MTDANISMSCHLGIFDLNRYYEKQLPRSIRYTLKLSCDNCFDFKMRFIKLMMIKHVCFFVIKLSLNIQCFVFFANILHGMLLI